MWCRHERVRELRLDRSGRTATLSKEGSAKPWSHERVLKLKSDESRVSQDKVLNISHALSHWQRAAHSRCGGGTEVWWLSKCNSWNFLQLEVCKPHFLGQPKWHIPCIDTALYMWMHAKSQRKHLNIICHYCYYISATATVILFTTNWCVPSLSHI